ncbi:hypothetical protein SAY86_022704 [Trapa natans]|uniref:Uncharacterized protein n=1 Tax=Trapa natans TaxID=22666 RepID=A0AAN7LW22_TRANT|nr:hypothetical protein SAY86_022704 [Trapa natans]
MRKLNGQCIGVVNEPLRVANILSRVFRRAMTIFRLKAIGFQKDGRCWRHSQPCIWRFWSPITSRTLEHSTPGDCRIFGGGPRLCPGCQSDPVRLPSPVYHSIQLDSGRRG